MRSFQDLNLLYMTVLLAGLVDVFEFDLIRLYFNRHCPKTLFVPYLFIFILHFITK